MGRKNKNYFKDLREQVHEKLVNMQAFGESKREAKKDGTEKDKIFSFGTYETYWKHCKYFVSWINKTYPECTTLRSAKRHVNEWLEYRANSVNKSGEPLSAWTIQTECASLNKLFGIDKSDPNRFQPPQRRREDIRRSRVDVKQDRHFSKTNHAELIDFCRGTGCRRGVLERLEGRDLWTREMMEDKVRMLEGKVKLSAKEEHHLATLRDALRVFPEEKEFLHHRKDKNGKYRFSPIVGPKREQIIERMQSTAPKEKVWEHVPKSMDVHSYRADYATRLYKDRARDIDRIPFDRINRGTGHRYQSQVYVCRKDEAGKRLDKRAMAVCSKALGHNRISVIADHYLRGL